MTCRSSCPRPKNSSRRNTVIRSIRNQSIPSLFHENPCPDVDTIKGHGTLLPHLAFRSKTSCFMDDDIDLESSDDGVDGEGVVAPCMEIAGVFFVSDLALDMLLLLVCTRCPAPPVMEG